MHNQVIFQHPPSPFLPNDVDLNGIDMPFEISFVRAKEWESLSSRPSVAFAKINLICESWEQLPAASLPKDNLKLMALSKCPSLDEWEDIRDEVLQDWVLCSDQRFYHQKISLAALKAHIKNLQFKLRGGAGIAKRWGNEFPSQEFRDRIELSKKSLAALEEKEVA